MYSCVYLTKHQTVHLELVNFMASKLYFKKADEEGGRKRGKEEKRWVGKEEEENDKERKAPKERDSFIQSVNLKLSRRQSGLGTKRETFLILRNL